MSRVPAVFQKKILFNSDHTETREPIPNAKKGNMSIDEYTNAFTEKIEFTFCIVPNELSKIYRYDKVFPWEYSVLVHQPTTVTPVDLG